jgi:hypothetical protein
VLENTLVGSKSVPPLDPNRPAGSMAQAYRDMDTCEPVRATSSSSSPRTRRERSLSWTRGLK